MNNKGFSLTEMSVVMVIIAVIIAGVLKGRNLLTSAKLRAILAEVERHKISFNSFNAKFDAYPGDFNEANLHWSGSFAGDGDNKIEFTNTNDPIRYEGYLAWQHLSYARMIDDPFPGTATEGVPVLGTDIPRSKSDGGYFFDNGMFGLTNDNIIVLGLPVSMSQADGNIRVDGIFIPPHAFEIDSKSDDGSPTNGSIRGRMGDSSIEEDCYDDQGTIGDTSDDIYRITDDDETCTMAFKLISQ